MNFGIFYEHQLPRPAGADWDDDAERRLYHEALEQVELADRVGIDCVWEVEHHFLEEYSHSSAPEVFLAACSQRTKRIRLGHGITLMPPPYNHPARVAERIAALDLVSNGRVEWGTGESATTVEMGGFRIDPADKESMWREGAEQAANMPAMRPYPGFDGQWFAMPCRNIVPKPVQKPRRCGLPARAAKRSIAPPAPGSARWPSRSSNPSRRRNGSRIITRSSNPRNACRSVIRSIQTSPSSPACRVTGTRTRRSAAVSTASASSAIRSGTTRCLASTGRA